MDKFEVRFLKELDTLKEHIQRLEKLTGGPSRAVTPEEEARRREVRARIVASLTGKGRGVQP